MLESKLSQIKQFFYSRANNSGHSGPIRSKIKLIRDLMVIYILTNWLISVDASVNKVKYGNFLNSRANNSSGSGRIRTKIKVIRDLMVMYILTMFGADWLIFVNARV